MLSWGQTLLELDPLSQVFFDYLEQNPPKKLSTKIFLNSRPYKNYYDLLLHFFYKKIDKKKKIVIIFFFYNPS